MRKKHRRLFLELGLVIAALAALLWVSVPRFLAVQNINTPENFPDPRFRRMVEEFMGVEPGGIITLAEARITTGNFPFPASRPVRLVMESGTATPLKNLQGIEFFPNLSSVSLSYQNQLRYADFSKNTLLLELTLANCALETLILPKNGYLQRLNVTSNLLTSLDVRSLPNLETLRCGYNQITSLYLSGNPNLKILSCYSNRLSTLDLTHQQKLAELDCSVNKITNIASPLPASLVKLDLCFNWLSGLLPMAHMQKLRMVDISYNRLECDDWQDVKALQEQRISSFTYSPQFTDASVPFECPDS